MTAVAVIHLCKATHEHQTGDVSARALNKTNSFHCGALCIERGLCSLCQYTTVGKFVCSPAHVFVTDRVLFKQADKWCHRTIHTASGELKGSVFMFVFSVHMYVQGESPRDGEQGRGITR